MDKSVILILIEEAFADMPMPRQAVDTETIPYADYEGRRVNEFFSGRSREEITVESLKTDFPGDYSAALLFMNESATIYYLPQFMKLCVEHHDQVDILPLSLLALLSGGRSDEERDWLERLLAKLTNKQKAAVAGYLEYSFKENRDDFLSVDFGEVIKPFSKR